MQAQFIDFSIKASRYLRVARELRFIYTRNGIQPIWDEPARRMTFRHPADTKFAEDLENRLMTISYGMYSIIMENGKIRIVCLNVSNCLYM